MDLLKDISPAQWAMLVLGVVFIGLSFKDDIRRFLARRKDNKDKDIKLTTLVRKWEVLRNACHDAGLHRACNKLDEVFPMLVEVNDE